MGATWFFSNFNNMFKALKSIDLGLMEQFMKGTIMYESDPGKVRTKSSSGDYNNMFRIKGGTSNFVNTLRSKIDKDKVMLKQVVTNINKLDGEQGGLMEVVTRDSSFRARRVDHFVFIQQAVSTFKLSP